MKERTLRKDDRQNNSGAQASLVLYNDDINTFAFVIKTLVEVCGHDPVQAEQCAMIVHLKGKCGIKNGMARVLNGMCLILKEKGLTAEVCLN